MQAREHIYLMAEDQTGEHCMAMLLWEWLEVGRAGQTAGQVTKLMVSRCLLQKRVWPGRIEEVRLLMARSYEAEPGLWEAEEAVLESPVVHTEVRMAALRGCLDLGKAL